MRIFLTGASGFVGGHLRRLLLALDHQVVGLARGPQPAEAGLRWVHGDIGDVNQLREGMVGCDVVIHLVGIIREQGEATFEAVHVKGTENVLRAMREAQIPRMLHMSALGAAAGSPLRYYETKWRAEETVRASDLAYAILRPSIIFGPGDGFISLLAAQLRSYPLVPLIGQGQYRLAPVSIHTVLAAFAQALSPRHPATGHVLDLCGPEVLSYRRILEIIGRRLRRFPPLLPLPVSLMRLALKSAGLLHLPLPITEEQLAMLLQENVCADDSAYEYFDLPRMTLAEGIKEYL